MTMQPQQVFRFEIPDRETLERIASDPLPDGFDEVVTGLELFRDIYYDTAAADLVEKQAMVRLRLRNNGPATLSVSVLERRSEDGILQRRTSEQEVQDVPPASLFANGSAPGDLLRGIIDPSRLAPVFEVEVMRRARTARCSAPGASDGQPYLQLALDLITARAQELSGELLELELGVTGHDIAAVSPLVQHLQRTYQLKPLFAETASRARELFDRLELRTLQRHIRSAREVAVVVHDGGSIALASSRGNLCLPWAPGSGAKACRRALRTAFGHGRGRMRLLGVRGDLPGRPAIEVWLAEDVAPNERAKSLTWQPVDHVLRTAGAPRHRDPRTLAALQVVARSSFLSWAPPAAGGTSLRRQASVAEPFEVVLQRLEAADTTWEAPAKDVPPELLLNMELSRLGFDERVLAMAEDPTFPLLERLRFLGMLGARRDDFFMSRVAHFKRLAARGSEQRSIDGMTPAETLDAIASRARLMTHRAYEVLNSRLLPELQQHGIRIEEWSALTDEERAHIWDSFGGRIEALVMPLVADPAHPFPHVRNLRPALAAIVRTPDGGPAQFVAIETPGDLPRFVPLEGGRRFVLLEDVLEATLPRLYPGLEVLRAHTFRVTRSAHMDIGGEPFDMLQAVEEEVSRRPFQEVVRLEVENAMPPRMRHELLREFQYELEEQLSTPGEQDVYTVGRLVDLAALEELATLDIPELRFEALQLRSPLETDRGVFDQVRERDQLFHYPYDDFEQTVERFLLEAANDPDVVSMRATLYRTGSRSGVVAALKQARARGKEVAVLVELKASFDERRNIEWARGLEQDGIRVVFSPISFKVHAKLALIVRREGAELRRYAYIGTGNLNAATARSYVDLGLLTADPDLGREVGAVFNLLTGYSGGGEFSRLLVAPFDMRRRLLGLIDREAAHAREGRDALIRLQLNGLADRRLIGALYRASAAGVRVKLMVREICSLRPGVKGVSENITVVSVTGRLLQHARIFHFRNGGAEEYYIGSADWRPRNMSERIEVAAPVTDTDHQKRLDTILETTLNDAGAWHLQSNGEYVRGTEGTDRTPHPAAATALPAD
jgi:polyphosphate kinase